MKKYKIALMGNMPANGYSGGRYHAWIMAEAIAQEANQVYIVTNNIPEFSQDFKNYPRHEQIQVILVNDFYNFKFPEKVLDYVICIPAIGAGKRFYYSCLDFAIRKNARFAFINFETPNWYHMYTKMNRPEKEYKILRNICRYGCLIFSSASESQKYALEYYDKFPERTEYCVWSPPINSVVADEVKVEKRNQILIFLRIKDKHKGGDDFLKLLGEYLRGMVCVCIVGNGEITQNFLTEAQGRAREYGILLKFEKSVSDYHKFQEIKKSKIVLFPSHFEGYGYPPVEALYCGTKCIVYDLPVLREISGDALTYCEPGNISLMREKARQLLKKEDIGSICVDTANFAGQAKRIQDILESNLNNSKLKYNRSANKRIWSTIRSWYYVRIDVRNKREFLPSIIKYCLNNETVISQELMSCEEKWSSIKRQIKGKKVYIWGCGRAYQELYPKYKTKVKVEGILDRSSEKIGKIDRISGEMLVQSPDILREKDKDLTVVLISNQESVDAIIGELREMGIRYYHSLCMIELNSIKSRIYKFWKKIVGR